MSHCNISLIQLLIGKLSFQYKILNRITNCREKLFLWKIVQNNKCIYCNDVDGLEHHFFDSVNAKYFGGGDNLDKG